MMISEDLALAEIRRVVEREVQLPHVVRPEDRLVDDLGLDSLTMTTLAVEIEDRFRIILAEDVCAQVRTVGDLIRCITTQTALAEAA